MARKANQQKNKVDRHSSSSRTKSSENAVQDKKSVGKADGMNNSFNEELQNGNLLGNSSMKGMGETNSVGDEYRIQKNSGRFVPKEQHGAETMQHLEESISCGSNPGEDIKNRAGSDAKEEKQTNSNFKLDSQHVIGSYSHLLNRLHLKAVWENVGAADNGVIRYLRQLFLSITKKSGEWLEKQKPLALDSKNKILNACGFIRRKMQLAYPIILKWLMHLGSFSLVFFVVWLDCALRGIGSLVHMGTVSFLLVIWCSNLSIIAMVGVFKFSIVLVMGALAAAFLGIALGILAVGIAGIVFLWFYGSFWATTLVIALAGLAFLLKYERPALLIATIYSVYCAWTYVGWLGLLLGLNMSFITSDVLIYFVKKNIEHRQPGSQFEPTGGMQDPAGLFNDENTSPSEAGQGFSADRSPGVPSTSICTSEDEVIRILNCTDHYSALGYTRFEDIDISLLKREYRKKAMLVHPDKNMGNEKAAEAFKKLQNAYEVLLDSLKRKAYDDELRSEELLNFFRRFQSNSQKNRRHGAFPFGFAQTAADGEDPFIDSRRISCKKCGGFHLWILTRKLKSRARWCQDCNDYHQAKDGDGWVEQFSRPFMFGLLQKVDAPTAFVCADSKIYDVTEWYTCQGMRVLANAHKPSFHVNTSVSHTKQNTGKGASSGQKGGRMPDINIEENMTQEEFVEWLQNAYQSGMFENFNGNTSTEATTKPGSNSKTGNSSAGSSSKRKKKGKKW